MKRRLIFILALTVAVFVTVACSPRLQIQNDAGSSLGSEGELTKFLIIFDGAEFDVTLLSPGQSTPAKAVKPGDEHVVQWEGTMEDGGYQMAVRVTLPSGHRLSQYKMERGKLYSLSFSHLFDEFAPGGW